MQEIMSLKENNWFFVSIREYSISTKILIKKEYNLGIFFYLKEINLSMFC